MCTWHEFQSPVTIQLESGRIQGAGGGGMPPSMGACRIFYGGDEARRTEMEWRWWFVDGGQKARLEQTGCKESKLEKDTLT